MDDEADLPQGRVLPTLDVDTGAHAFEHAGSYEVVRPVCADKHARLHLARNPRLARLVTLQELALPDAGDTGGAAQLVQRARRATRLRSPHLVEIYDYLEQAHDHFCAVMEPLFGQTLRTRINARDVTIREAVELTQAIASGLSALHAAGRIHGALGSSWVFLAEGERGARIVKLIDHGLGAEQEALLDLEEKAPEQRTLAPATALTDVYFLGSLLFEMLEGKRPFDLPESSSLSLAGEPIPPSLQAVIAQALKANPAHRYRSVEVFCAAVVEALDPKLLVPPVVRKSTAGRWLVAALVVALAGTGLWFQMPVREAFALEPEPPDAAPAPEPEIVAAPQLPSLAPDAARFLDGALKQTGARAWKKGKAKKSERR